MKLGFFGGSFNPPTIAHYNLIKQALLDYKFDNVYFVPVNNFYNKSSLIDINHRINMLKIISKNDNRILVSEIERDNNRLLKAIDVFELIEKKYPTDDIFFFMGEDNYCKIHKWKDYKKLKKYKYIVFQRDEKYNSEIKDENVIYMKNKENSKISSTIIRNKLKHHQSINNLVTQDVEKYITDNKLYLEDNI